MPKVDLYIVLIGLFSISWPYNALTDWVHVATKSASPWTSFLVVGGILYTIGGAVLVDGWATINVFTLLACFAASGLPMVVGDVLRYLRRGS